MNECLLETVLPWKKAVGGDLSDATILLVVSLSNTEHLLNDERMCRSIRQSTIPQAVLVPIIPSNVAFSAGLDDQTTRRRLAKLIDASLLERVDAGYVVSSGFLEGPAWASLTDFSLDQLSRLFGRLRRFDTAVAFLKGLHEIDAVMVESLSDDLRSIPTIGHLIFLKSFARIAVERFRSIGPSKNVSLVSMGYLVECVRSVTSSDQLAAEYAEYDSPLPDGLKTPVSVRTLAGVLDLPAETVRRYSKTLEAEGFIVRQGGGYVTPRSSLMDETIMFMQATVIARLGQQIGGALTSLSDGHAGAREASR
jgi:hypothetical protein